jgi:hypothetical protein
MMGQMNRNVMAAATRVFEPLARSRLSLRVSSLLALLSTSIRFDAPRLHFELQSLLSTIAPHH